MCVPVSVEVCMPFKNQDFHYNRDSSVSLAPSRFFKAAKLKRRNSLLFVVVVVVVFAIYFIHVQKYTNMLN